eukprot:TRINITY_DN2793_c0_g1_i1.p1 TRINITY_DN2793_c0_g1~~TRINITY_DN2793_c0_g1_i1.p1  ORF type:complete len:913 (+),score=204.32 TRINITY_DN2793_c0_g1_i1:110-2740(+)
MHRTPSTKNTSYRAMSSSDYGTLHSIIAHQDFHDYNHHELRYYDSLNSSSSFSSSGGFAKKSSSSSGGFSKSSGGFGKSSKTSAFGKKEDKEEKKSSLFGKKDEKKSSIFSKKKDDEEKKSSLWGSKDSKDSKPAVQQHIVPISQQLQLVVPGVPDITTNKTFSNRPKGLFQGKSGTSSLQLKVQPKEKSPTKSIAKTVSPKLIKSRLNVEKFKNVAKIPTLNQRASLFKTEKPVKLTRSVLVDTPSFMTSHRSRKTLKITTQPPTDHVMTPGKSTLTNDFLTPSRGIRSDIGTTPGWANATPQYPFVSDTLNNISLPETTGQTESPMPILPPEMPIFTKQGYSIQPSLSELENMSRKELESVRGFTIENSFGCIKWMNSVDLNGVNIDEAVNIFDAEVVVYDNEATKPPVGQKLNGRAIVTLYNIFPSPEMSDKEFENMIVDITAEIDAKFISYSADGKWSFEVAHFSKYGLKQVQSSKQRTFNKRSRKNAWVELLSETDIIKEKDLYLELLSSCQMCNSIHGYYTSDSLGNIDVLEFSKCKNSHFRKNIELFKLLFIEKGTKKPLANEFDLIPEESFDVWMDLYVKWLKPLLNQQYDKVFEYFKKTFASEQADYYLEVLCSLVVLNFEKAANLCIKNKDYNLALLVGQITSGLCRQGIVEWLKDVNNFEFSQMNVFKQNIYLLLAGDISCLYHFPFVFQFAGIMTFYSEPGSTMTTFLADFDDLIKQNYLATPKNSLEEHFIRLYVDPNYSFTVSSHVHKMTALETFIILELLKRCGYSFVEETYDKTGFEALIELHSQGKNYKSILSLVNKEVQEYFLRISGSKGFESFEPREIEPKFSSSNEFDNVFSYLLQQDSNSTQYWNKAFSQLLSTI